MQEYRLMLDSELDAQYQQDVLLIMRLEENAKTAVACYNAQARRPLVSLFVPSVHLIDSVGAALFAGHFTEI